MMQHHLNLLVYPGHVTLKEYQEMYVAKKVPTLPSSS